MAWTQADLDALETAIKAGAEQVHFADRSVTYASLDKLMKLRAAMKAEIDAAAGVTVADRTSLASHSRG